LSVLRSREGRIRGAWRLGLFVVLTVVLVAALGLLAMLLPDDAASSALRLGLGAAASLLAVLGASWWMMERVEGTSLAALGLPVDGLLPRELGAGFLLGGGLIALVVLALALPGWVAWRLEPGGFAPGPFLVSFLQLSTFLLVAAFLEELLFRGYPLQVLAEAWGGAAAVGATAVVFGLFHAWNPGLGASILHEPSLAKILPLINIALAGLILGLAYWRTYSLWYATGVHLGWNWVMGFATDLPVSGLEPSTPGYALFDTPGFDAVVRGPSLWTGGSFGPEGGLLVTLASLAGIAWLVRTDRLHRALRVRALGPLPDRRDGGPGASRTGGSPGAAGAGERVSTGGEAP
jgi:membrane protease YdiL (CAAX protease family)